jgi:WD40 repeat protein
MFATAGDDGLLMVWETSTGKRRYVCRGHEGPINQIAWHPDGRRIYTSSFDNTAKLWDLDKPGDLDFDVCKNGPWYAPVSADGNYMAAACSDKKITVWDINKGTLTVAFDSVAANCAAFSKDGNYLYVSGHDELVRGYDLKAKKEMFIAKGHINSVYGIAVSGKKNIVASSGGRSIHLWNLKTGDSIKVLPTPESGAYAVQFSPDEKQMIAGLSNGKINIYNTADWQVEDTLQSGKSLYYLEVHPSGKYLISSGAGGAVHLWNMQTKKLLHELKGHHKEVFAVAFHPVKPLAITGSYDRNVKFWNLETGECLLTISGFDQEIYNVAITKDGNRVVITETEGLIHVIDL